MDASITEYQDYMGLLASISTLARAGNIDKYRLRLLFQFVMTELELRGAADRNHSGRPGPRHAAQATTRTLNQH